jgi:hypothetical protein
MALQPFVGPWPLQFLNIFFTQTVGLLGRVISPSQGRYLHTGRHKHGINAHTQTSTHWVELEPTIPAFERAKTFHALDREATVISWLCICKQKFEELLFVRHICRGFYFPNITRFCESYVYCLLRCDFLPGLFFSAEDGGFVFLQNIGLVSTEELLMTTAVRTSIHTFFLEQLLKLHEKTLT